MRSSLPLRRPIRLTTQSIFTSVSEAPRASWAAAPTTAKHQVLLAGSSILQQSPAYSPHTTTTLNTNPLSRRAFSATRVTQKKKPAHPKGPEIEAQREAARKSRQAVQQSGRSVRHEDVLDSVNSVREGNDLVGPDGNNAYDFADVTASYANIDARFEDNLKRFQNTGETKAHTLGMLRVRPDRNNPDEHHLLKDVAEVQHRGRTLTILVADPAYIKPVMSAIQACEDFNQQPQKSPDNDLELVMKVEADKPEEVIKRAKLVFTQWKDKVRTVMASREKAQKQWLSSSLITKDDHRSLQKSVKALQDKHMEKVEKREKAALQTIASRQTKL